MKGKEVGAVSAVFMAGLGFYTGNDYLKLGENSRRTYVTGIIDGFHLAFGESPKSLKWITNCTKGKDNFQITAIVDKFLSENPQRWPEPMNVLVYDSLVNICPL
jgi:hypothetical protein